MSASATIKKYGLEKAFPYMYKDPEKNLPKLIDWADKFAKGEFPSQRAAVRAAFTDPDYAYSPFVRHMLSDVDPCVFVHYSDSNIREKTLLEAMRSPLFQAYHDGQPFNENMMQPCPMLENPAKLRGMIEKTGARSTDMQSPESADHLCAKCDGYAACWAPKAEEIWEARKDELARKHTDEVQ